jgi:large subunit ribosomal protein L20
MPRVKRGVTARNRHKKVLAEAKGYYGARSRVYRVAKQAVINSGVEIDRKVLADLAVSDKAAFAAIAAQAKAALSS